MARSFEVHRTTVVPPYQLALTLFYKSNSPHIYFYRVHLAYPMPLPATAFRCCNAKGKREKQEKNKRCVCTTLIPGELASKQDESPKVYNEHLNVNSSCCLLQLFSHWIYLYGFYLVELKYDKCFVWSKTEWTVIYIWEKYFIN